MLDRLRYAKLVVFCRIWNSIFGRLLTLNPHPYEEWRQSLLCSFLDSTYKWNPETENWDMQESQVGGD